MDPSTPFRPDHRHRGDDLSSDFNDLDEAERERLMTERVRLLHVHGPMRWHDTVSIDGNRNGLLVLRDAVDEALSSPVRKGETSAMVSDGEGFSVVVTLVDEPWTHPAWEAAPLPYLHPSACGRPDPDSDLALLRYALRQANARLLKRGVRPVADPTIPAPSADGGA